MFRLLLALALVAPVLAGQPTPAPLISITGVVQPLAAPSTCQAGATHRLDCTKVALHSSVLDLTALEGQNVRLLAKPTSAGCVVLDVLSAQVPPPASLQLCGTPALGCPIRVKICPPGLSKYWLFAGFSPGFKPLGTEKGTWLIGAPFFLLAQGMLDIACAQLDMTVPNDPALVGLPVQLQAARKPFGTGQGAVLTNAICFTILPGTVPCQQPNC